MQKNAESVTYKIIFLPSAKHMVWVIHKHMLEHTQKDNSQLVRVHTDASAIKSNKERW